MKSRREKPVKAERMSKPIAPNPWRRGRRRTGGQGAHAHGATEIVHSSSPTTFGRPNGDDNATGVAISLTETNGATDRSAEAPIVKDRAQVIGLFSDRGSAERACRALAERGYREDAIKLMISEETCTRHFADYSDRALPLSGSIDLTPQTAATFSHRPRQCPATLDVAIYTTATHDATATLAELLSGSGVPYSRVAEYEMALRNGAVLLSVLPRSHDDARLIDIEWRRSYRAEKVHS